jgi:hypothetical protein
MDAVNCLQRSALPAAVNHVTMAWSVERINLFRAGGAMLAGVQLDLVRD